MLAAWEEAYPGKSWEPGTVWVEPWVGRAWEDWDVRASLSDVGLPVVPVDLDALSVPHRMLIGEWAADYAKRKKKAHDEAVAAAKKKGK